MAIPHLKRPTSRNAYKPTIKYRAHKIARTEPQCVCEWAQPYKWGMFLHLEPERPKVKCGWALA